jgi:transcriptional regulator with XRE-family HTH domain
MRDWLKEKRELKKLTHSEVADQSNISRSYYTHIENGTKTPTVEVAKSIGSVLDFTWTIFFDNKCSPKEQTA